MTMLSLLSRAADDSALSGFKYYHYDPSKAAAIIFVILFVLSTILHFYQMIRTRTWFFIPFCIGGLFEVVGYIGRAMSASQESGQWTLGPYIIQSLLLLVAPALFAASIYMELGRIVILADADNHLFIRRTWLTKIFVAGDVLSFLMQGSGGGLMASKNTDSINTGTHIVLGGIWVQVIFFGLFVITSGLFHKRIKAEPTRASLNTPWQRHLFALYATSLLILVRSIFRVADYAQGFNGSIMQHEFYLYVFDALLMFASMAIMNWIHPSQIQSLIAGGKPPSGVQMENFQV